MDQGVRYVVRLEDVNVTSGLRNMETSANRAEGAVVDLNSALRDIAATVGVGFGLREVFNFAKDAVSGAADYETAVKRIMFASESMADGLRNVAFINAEADKFKIPLQETTDAYGKFLAMLNGSGIAADKVRELHDEVLMIGKIKGLDAGQINAAAMNIGKMLEAGGLDARHFRPLEQQLSGIGTFVAKELGISVHQLAELRNKGKMSQVDPQVLLNAIRKQAESLQQFFPESTSTIASRLAELDNAWLRFKNDLVFNNINELRSLFHTLQDGIAFLKDHEQTIISIGKAIIRVGEGWLIYKGLVLGAQAVDAVYLAFMEGYTGKIVSMAEAEAEANNLRAASYVRLAEAIEASNVASQHATVFGAAGLGKSGVPLLAAGETAVAGTAVAETAAIGGLGSIVSAMMPVALGLIVAGAAVNLIGSAYSDWYDEHYGRVSGRQDKVNPDAPVGVPTQPGAASTHIPGIVMAPAIAPLTVDTLHLGTPRPLKDKSKETEATDKYKIVAPNDRVTGQRVLNYNIRIDKIIGQENGTLTVEGTKADTDTIALRLRDIILSIVNDSQLRDGH
jgi:tape measure domain-containing protein